MSKTTKNNIILSTIGIFILYFLYSVKGILLPFVLGIIIAYFLNKTTTKLERVFFNSRKIASIFVITIFITLILILITLIIPIVVEQTFNLVKEIVNFFKKDDSNFLSNKIAMLLEYFDIQDSVDYKKYLINYGNRISEYLMSFFNNLLSKSMAFINIISLLIITPITAYYFLNDWNKMLRKIKSFIPPKNREKYVQLFRKINEVLYACVKEQFNVCLILSVFYGTLLKFTGLKYGFLIGFLTGVASFIPFIGMIFGFAAAMIMTLYQFGLDIPFLLIVSGIFFAGQILESNFLTPNLVGNKINLHPLWIIFALFSGGTLFGLVGMLFALPVASVLGVVVRFIIKEKIKYIKKDEQ